MEAAVYKAFTQINEMCPDSHPRANTKMQTHQLTEWSRGESNPRETGSEDIVGAGRPLIRPSLIQALQDEAAAAMARDAVEAVVVITEAISKLRQTRASAQEVQRAS